MQLCTGLIFSLQKKPINQMTTIISFNNAGVLAPPCYVSVLHADVLLRIFELVIHSDDSNGKVPIILSQVSEHWRELATNTPMLWTQIRVHEILGLCRKHDMFKKTLRRVTHFLERSKQCPLSLDITIQTLHMRTSPLYHSDHPRKRYINSFRGGTQELSRILSTHVALFAEFRLLADEFYSITDIEKHLPCIPMPLLTYWRVAQTTSRMVLDPHLTNFKDQARLSILLRSDSATGNWYPKLRRVRLATIPMTWADFSPTNLQSLSLCLLPTSARPTIPELLAILLANANTLTVLDLDGCVRIGDTSAPPLTLPHVHFLKLGYKCARELVPLLTCLRVPRLRALELTDHQRAKLPPAQQRFDRTINELLNALIAHVPLAQLTHLELHNMRFLPPLGASAAPSAEFVSVRNAHGAFIPATLFGFLTALTALRALVLTTPDYALLAALNYRPPRPSCLGSGSGQAEVDPAVLPVPRMESLTMSAFNIFLVRDFLIFRFLGGLPRLATLNLGIPKEWMCSPQLLLAERVARTVGMEMIVLGPREEEYLLREFE